MQVSKRGESASEGSGSDDGWDGKRREERSSVWEKGMRRRKG
jgi:hypothetical protein